PPAPERHVTGDAGAGGHETHSRRRGGAGRDGSSVGLMAIRPAVLWGLLPEELKQTIASDLTTIVSEGFYVHDSHGATASSPSKSRDLHSAIHRAPGAHQPREPTAPTRYACAGPPPRLAR